MSRKKVESYASVWDALHERFAPWTGIAFFLCSLIRAPTYYAKTAQGSCKHWKCGGDRHYRESRVIHHTVKGFKTDH